MAELCELSKSELNDLKAELRAYRTNLDSDDVFCKEIIKDKLLKNNKIIYLLNNKELQDAGASNDEYFGTNILGYYMITPTQTNVQNFICYEVQFDEVARYNKKIKYGQIIFYILCEQKTLTEKTTGLARHDLIAALIMEEFNWTNCFGTQVSCISDKASVVDTDYACRTLIFEMETPNNLIKNQYRKIFNEETGKEELSANPHVVH